jgi:hypothetical protein
MRGYNITAKKTVIMFTMYSKPSRFVRWRFTSGVVEIMGRNLSLRAIAFS